MTNKNTGISADTLNFCELMQKELAIPEYQRPYTWGKKNIDKMLEDFDEFLEKQQDYYYFGTVVLHKDNKNSEEICNIIDGQQRITTLILLNYMLNNFNDTIDLKYSNLQSQTRIKENYKYLMSKENLEDYKNIFNKLLFTIVTTDNQDKAFIFFDTQNNRGVKPDVTVLLKAYNLRCIENADIQKKYALTWESQEKISHNMRLGEIHNQIEWLIKIYFYRVRNWRGNNQQNFGNFESFRDNFTKKLRNGKNEYIKYPSTFAYKKITKQQIIATENGNIFSFNTRQPLYSGECFFEFVKYYGDLLTELENYKINHQPFRELQTIFYYGSRYMASFFTMTTLLYYERFGTNNLDIFITNLSHLIANIRLKQSRILKPTMQIQFIRAENEDIKYNMFDFLTNAFDSDEVIEWLGEIKGEELTKDESKGKRKTFNDEYKEFWGVKK